MTRIENWAGIRDHPWKSLLLGNGASIALHGGFKYDSLFAQANKTNAGFPDYVSMFDGLRTTDFERVLLACDDATVVNNALQIDGGERIKAAKAKIREALIAAVRTTHCDYWAVAGKLDRIGQFASTFDKVITFNYDLTLYWAMMMQNATSRRFMDAFFGGVFDTEWKRHEAVGTSLVFYAHGSLVLARGADGSERKLKANSAKPPSGQPDGGQSKLLETILREWETGTLSPLFVCEGTSQEKRQEIGRSLYLTRVHQDVMSQLGDTVVYGLNFHESDHHILDAIARNPPQRVAVSVFKQDEVFCARIAALFKKRLRSAELVFFDASSPGCWANEPSPGT